MHRLYPDLYEVFAKPDVSTDSRTFQERIQDRVDSTRDQDIDRPWKLGKVPNLVAPLRNAIPKEVLTRAEADDPKSWEIPTKAFEINLVFPIERSTISIHRSGSSRTPYLLTIDLRDQDFSIYSENGKRLLRETFLDETAKSTLADASAEVHDFLMLIADGREDKSWRSILGGDLLPLRWASAGVLPIVRSFRRGTRPNEWKPEGDWVALFFRDIPPIGLNVGNGASESANERHDLPELIGREFAEELVLTNRRPESGKSVEQLIFRNREGGRALSDPAVFGKFVARHHELRKKHDNLKLTVGQEPRFLTSLETPFGVRVFDTPGRASRGRGDALAEQITRCGNVIFSINPAELGIEVIRPYRFDFHEGEWLMDGELLPSSRSSFPYLVRRPIVLLRLDFLKKQFKENDSLGDIVNDADSLGGKLLPEIPVNDVRVFAEIGPREVRLEKVKYSLKSCTDENELRSLKSEERLLEGWLEKYGGIFGGALAGREPLSAEALRTLCPVSYKTIELALRHQIL